jgi:AbrB family looped-hinge helix DNA binding protein
METKVSTKGQVVLPGPVRRRLGIRAGDRLDVTVDEDRIVLAKRTKFRHKPRIVKDPKTGLIALLLGPDAPILTSERVKELLADFP